MGSVVTNVLLQLPLLSKQPLRWLMHFLVFWGFITLILFHALDDTITTLLLTDYEPTLNPYRFIRNGLGAFVLIGLGIAIVRRMRVPALKRISTPMDLATLAILLLIILSGIALESTTMISERLFDEMVADYMGSDIPEEIAPLKALWAKEFGVVFTPSVEPGDQELMDEGRELHADYCAACHASAGSAFLSYPVARLLAPIGGFLNQIDVNHWVWWLHVLLSLFALAYLPFGKLFHILATPAHLILNTAGNSAAAKPANKLTIRAVGLDACTHCGVCSRHCRVAPIYQIIPNATILPSEKIGAIAQMVRPGGTDRHQALLSEGSRICTDCGNCTLWCPAGIDLEDLWQAGRSELTHRGYPAPFQWIRHQSADQWAKYPSAIGDGKQTTHSLELSNKPDSFWDCIQCTTCTSVCPVVAVSEDPQRDLDWTPQQIMNLMRLQLKELALGSQMVWDCVTCYSCQEHCPQGVKVADVLYELRNEAYRRFKPRSMAPPADPDPTQNVNRSED